MRTISFAAMAACALLPCALLAGCGGGGGGGGPAPIATGTFAAQAAGAQTFTLAANVTGAVASGTRVTVYGDQRTGPVNAYTSSKRLTLNLYGPVRPGTYPISTSRTAGTAEAVYLETVLQNAVYVTAGIWPATSGSVVVNAADGRHVEGTFTLSTRRTTNGSVITWENGRFSVLYETPPGPPS